MIRGQGSRFKAVVQLILILMFNDKIYVKVILAEISVNFLIVAVFCALFNIVQPM